MQQESPQTPFTKTSPTPPATPEDTIPITHASLASIKPPSSNNKLIQLLSFLLILALAIAGLFAFKYYQSQPNQNIDQISCTLDAKMCPDGSAVGRSGPNCEFAPCPLIDPTANWQTYANDEYTFKYPSGLQSDTDAAGAGVDSIRFTYLGPTQIDSGRTETEVFDGYQFVVTKVETNTTLTAQEKASQDRTNSQTNCPENSTISNVFPTQISGLTAYQYSATGCFSDYTTSYVVNNDNLYSITQSHAGEPPKDQEYKEITVQILSTFQFTN